MYICMCICLHVCHVCVYGNISLQYRCGGQKTTFRSMFLPPTTLTQSFSCFRCCAQLAHVILEDSPVWLPSHHRNASFIKAHHHFHLLKCGFQEFKFQSLGLCSRCFHLMRHLFDPWLFFFLLLFFKVFVL